MTDDAAPPVDPSHTSTLPARTGAQTREPTDTCNARTRNDSYCDLPAGHGTDHLGQGRCKWHGGSTPIKSGRYSKITRERIRDLITKHESDADPLDLLPEVAVLRALFEDFIERYDLTTDALLAWHASHELTRHALPADMVDEFTQALERWKQAAMALNSLNLSTEDKRHADQAVMYLDILKKGPDEARPRRVMDIMDAHNIIEGIGRMVERIEKVRSQNAISRPDLNRVMQEMFRSLDMRVKDDELKQQIVNDWMRIAL